MYIPGQCRSVGSRWKTSYKHERLTTLIALSFPPDNDLCRKGMLLNTLHLKSFVPCIQSVSSTPDRNLCSLHTVIFPTDRGVPVKQFKTNVFLINNCVPYRELCSLQTVVFLTNSFVPYRQLFYVHYRHLCSIQTVVFFTVMFLTNSCVLYRQLCSLQTVVFLTDSCVSYTH